MVHIVSLEAVTASVGEVAGALAVMTDNVRTTVDWPALGTNAELDEADSGSPMDRYLTGKRDLIREWFQAAAAEVPVQTDITERAADHGTTALRNADIDGGNIIRSAAV